MIFHFDSLLGSVYCTPNVPAISDGGEVGGKGEEGGREREEEASLLISFGDRQDLVPQPPPAWPQVPAPELVTEPAPAPVPALHLHLALILLLPLLLPLPLDLDLDLHLDLHLNLHLHLNLLLHLALHLHLHLHLHLQAGLDAGGLPVGAVPLQAVCWRQIQLHEEPGRPDA